MDIGELVTHFGADTKEMQAGVARSQALVKNYEKQVGVTGTRTVSSFKKMGAAVQRVSRVVSYLGIAMGAAVIGGVFASWARQSIQFQTKFAEVKTLFDETKFSAKSLQQGMTQLSGAYGTMTEKASALYQVISAGIEVNKSVAFLGDAAKFAKAGVTDLLSSVDLLTTSINSYGMEADKVGWVSDILFETIKRGKTTAGELAGSFGRVLATAAAIGVTFEELNAAVATLTASGIATTETMSGLKQVFANIAKPQGKAAETAKQLGIDFSVAGLKAKGLEGFLKELITTTEGNIQAQINLFGSVEAFNSIAVLASEAGGRRFTAALEGMGIAAGNTFTALEKFRGTFAFEWERLWNNMAKSLTGVEAPLGRLLQGINEVMEQSARFPAMLERNGGINTQANALKVLGGSFQAADEYKRMEKEFNTFTLSAQQLNVTLSEEFNKSGMTMEKVYSKFGDLTGMLTPQLKKFGLEVTDGMARIMDYTEMLKEESDMIHILTKSGVGLDELVKNYAEDIVQLAADHKSFTKEALDPTIQKALEMAEAFITLRDAVKNVIPTSTDYTGLLSGEFQQAWETQQDKKDLMGMMRTPGKLPAGYAMPSTLFEQKGYAEQFHLGGSLTDQTGLGEELWKPKLPAETWVFPTPDETGITVWGEVTEGLTNKFDLLGTAISGMGEAFRMAVSGQSTFAEAFKRMSLSIISSLSQMAIVEAATQFAKGLSAAANPLTASLAPGYFRAAAAWAAVGITSGAASMALSGGGGGGGTGLGPQGTAFNPMHTTDQSNVMMEISQAMTALTTKPGVVVVQESLAQGGGIVGVSMDNDLRNLSNEITGSDYV